MTKKTNSAEDQKKEKKTKTQQNNHSDEAAVEEESVKILSEDEIQQNNIDADKDKAEEYKDMLQRLQAEFDNYRKRTSENARISRSDGICDVIMELLPAIDNIERGLTLIKDESAKSGMEIILKQLLEVLKKFDVCEIKAMGEAFNPDFHHAIARDDEDDNENENKVSEVYVKGYQRKTKILRPAMVKVSNK